MEINVSYYNKRLGNFDLMERQVQDLDSTKRYEGKYPVQTAEFAKASGIADEPERNIKLFAVVGY